MKNKQKRLKSQGKKQIDAITNQNQRLEALTNKDDHKSIYKEIFDKLVLLTVLITLCLKPIGFLL